ncbi:MAG: hypothetical protein SVK54_02825 [candidate division WOR-3 bacterium]|nr:hypothetical protein [candidate division WOR-3 bacterium]
MKNVFAIIIIISVSFLLFYCNGDPADYSESGRAHSAQMTESAERDTLLRDCLILLILDNSIYSAKLERVFDSLTVKYPEHIYVEKIDAERQQSLIDSFNLLHLPAYIVLDKRREIVLKSESYKPLRITESKLRYHNIIR